MIQKELYLWKGTTNCAKIIFYCIHEKNHFFGEMKAKMITRNLNRKSVSFSHTEYQCVVVIVWCFSFSFFNVVKKILLCLWKREYYCCKLLGDNGKNMNINEGSNVLTLVLYFFINTLPWESLLSYQRWSDDIFMSLFV